MLNHNLTIPNRLARAKFANTGEYSVFWTYFEDVHGLQSLSLSATPAWPDCGRGTEFLAAWPFAAAAGAAATPALFSAAAASL